MSKSYFCFNHNEPDYPIITHDAQEADTYDYYDEIETIEPNKKSLIANDDENIIIYAENTTQEEWENHLRDVFNKALEEAEENHDNFIYIEEFGDEFDINDMTTADQYVDFWNNKIENSFVDGDSGYQVKWYEN